ncbi:hypothetical protein [Kitasatospora griseola]|uniref:hypothetical protein n=1 Tax=Kitasatospora griseola TaxID=2064 RepID=UPI003807ADAF
MESYDGIATLEWWANPSTCLGSFRVALSVSAVGDGWKSVAMLDGRLSEVDRGGFDFLLQLDPVFTLRFTDGSTVWVNVLTEGANECLMLTPFEPGEQATSRTAVAQ